MPFLTLHCCLRILHQNCKQHIFLQYCFCSLHECSSVRSCGGVIHEELTDLAQGLGGGVDGCNQQLENEILGGGGLTFVRLESLPRYLMCSCNCLRQLQFHSLLAVICWRCPGWVDLVLVETLQLSSKNWVTPANSFNLQDFLPKHVN